MNLHLLRIFSTVVRQNSFSLAAKELFISQPAVSKAVRTLETQLGLPLLEHHLNKSRKIVLTEAGKTLIEYARNIFTLEKNAIDEIKAQMGLISGHLTIGASTTIAGYWLAPYLAKFLKQYPSVQLKMRVGNTQTITQALINCELDIGLIEGQITHTEQMTATHWKNDELIIISHPNLSNLKNKKTQLKKLNEQTWIVREVGSGTYDITKKLMQTYHINPSKKIELASNESIAHAVAEGIGIAILPECILHNLLKTKKIIKVNFPFNQPLYRPLFYLQLKNRKPSPFATAFYKLLASK